MTNWILSMFFSLRLLWNLPFMLLPKCSLKVTLCRIGRAAISVKNIVNVLEFSRRQQILRTTMPTTNKSLVQLWALLCQPLWPTWLWKTWSNDICPPLSSSPGFGNDMLMMYRYVPQLGLALYKPCTITWTALSHWSNLRLKGKQTMKKPYATYLFVNKTTVNLQVRSITFPPTWRGILCLSCIIQLHIKRLLSGL